MGHGEGESRELRRVCPLRRALVSSRRGFACEGRGAECGVCAVFCGILMRFYLVVYAAVCRVMYVKMPLFLICVCVFAFVWFRICEGNCAETGPIVE